MSGLFIRAEKGLILGHVLVSYFCICSVLVIISNFSLKGVGLVFRFLSTNSTVGLELNVAVTGYGMGPVVILLPHRGLER